MTTRIAPPAFAFRRLAIAGLLGAALVGTTFGTAQAAPCYFGECGTPSAPTPAPATTSSSDNIREISRHGTWTALTDGSSTLIINRFDDGARFAIYDEKDQLSFVLTYDGWHYSKGESFTIKIDIDGDVYKGTIVASDATTLTAKNVTRDIVRALHDGRKAKISFANDTFTMTSLPDAAAAIDDAVRAQKTSSR